MNAMMHSRISAKRWGGCAEDYYPIHEFIDSTKEMCGDGRHRIFHTMWAVNRLVVPIFGHTLVNSEGKSVDVKDLCERDHLLVDYGNKYIPTLSDFVGALNSNRIPDLSSRIERFHQDFVRDEAISTLLLSPLMLTGQVKSLIFTHNSWFVGCILPRIFDIKMPIQDFDIGPDMVFDAMDFQFWMDNGLLPPPSGKKLPGEKHE